MTEADAQETPHAAFNLSAWALRHRVLVTYLMVVVAVLGVMSYRQLGQSEDPPFTFKVMVVRSDWPGATAREVQEQVTDRIERKLQEMPRIDFVRSFSRPGRSFVFFTMADDAPSSAVPETFYQVRKKVGDIAHDLPTGVRGPYFNDEFGDVYVSLLALQGDDFTAAQRHDYAERLRNELIRLPDVGKVDLLGDAQATVYIEMDPERMARFGATPRELAQVLGQRNAVAPAGLLQTADDRIYVRPGIRWNRVEDIADTVVEVGGKALRIGDVAQVRRGYEDPPGDRMRFQGAEALGIGVTMVAGGDVIRLGHQLDDTVRRLQSHLPAGLTLNEVTSMPHAVEHSVDDFLESVAEAVAIVLLVSLMSLGLRTGLIVVVSIPLVLAATALGMNLAGIGLHKVSLGTLVLALGLLVDDAIIAVEMMAVKLEQGWERLEAAAFAYTSTAFPMLTGTLVTVSGFLPIALARSSTGEYTRSIFEVSALSLLISWVAAVIVIPLLGFHLLKPGAAHADGVLQRLLSRWRPGRPGAAEAASLTPHGRDPYDTAFYRRLGQVIGWCVLHRGTVLAAAGLLFVLALAGFGLLQQQFFPSSSRPELLVDLRLGEGASFDATLAQVKRLEARLAGMHDVRNEAAFVGTGAPRFYLPLDQQLASPNFAQCIVTAWDVTSRERLKHELEALLSREFPELRTRVSRLENGPPVGFPVQFRVSGDDITQVRAIADQISERMRAEPHTRNVQLDWEEMGQRAVRLEFNEPVLRRLGIARTDVADFLQTTFTGSTVTQYRDRELGIDVVLRAPRTVHTDPARLHGLSMPIGGGRSVPLDSIARIVPSIEYGVVWTRNRQATITVQGDVGPGVQAIDVTRVIDRDLSALRQSLPLGYRIEIGGAVENSMKAQASINAQMPIMILVVFTLLMIQLHSVSRVLMIIGTAPLGLIGVVPALLIFGKPFGFVAMLGTIAMLGIIMRNSVILVDQIDRDAAGGATPREAIVGATVRRFRPITLTAATAVLALIPLLGNDFFGPMATALMGGITVATVLTLFVLPALYALVFRVPRSAVQEPAR